MGGRDVRVKGSVKCGQTTNINVFMYSLVHIEAAFVKCENKGAPTLYPDAD
jgi:hypothetical protein